MTNWVSLHNHSSKGSLLDGFSKPVDMVAKCKEHGYKACAITDHGSISGCVDFFKECKDGGVKPILGCEFYICDDVSVKNKKLNHVVILAKNLKGWKELIGCVSESYLPDNFYYKPRIDHAIAKKFLGNGNHICISGHPGTEISESLFFSNDVFDAESEQEAKAFLKPMWKEDCRYVIDKYLDIFGENFFLEIQLIDKDNMFAAGVIANCLREIAKDLNLPTVATGDSHYVNKSDAVYQRILLCSSLKLKIPQVEKAIRKKEKVPLKCFFVSDNYHIPSPEEIAALHTQEEIDNAGRIADMCEEYDILSKPILPRFKCPNDMDEFEYLSELCRKGWQEKLVKKGVVSTQEAKDKYTARIKEELGIIKDAGLSGYFLIVQDIVNWVRSKGWLPGPGRGSAAGCLISYLVGITNIDPIPYNLLFSRFYNASRKGSLPDIDTDVPSEHRDEVIQYIKDKYGIANVSQMATFGRLQGRSAMKEVMSIEDNLSFAEMNAITEFIPDEAEISDELEEMDDKSIIRWALLNRPEKFEKWVKLVDNKLVGDLADTFEKGIKLEGTYKSQGKHAAGIIIAASPLADICPMVRDKEGNPLAGLEMGDLEAIGQVKFDILGVDILSKIQKIAEHGNIDLSDMNCEEAWNLLSGGDTIGVFQLESNLGRTWAKRVKPRNLEELSALVSLIRPGTLNAYLDGKSMTQHYVDRKHGLEDVVYLHPSLENTLKDTYGVLCIHENSLVSLNNGEEVYIKQIKVGDIINSIEQKKYTISPQTCDNVCVSPKTNGLKITLENGFSLTVTEDHKIYTLRGAIEAKDLKPDDLIQFVNNQKYTPKYSNLPIYSDAKWSYLCGQLVGDGCSGKAIASGTEENHLKLLKYLQDNFSDELNIHPYFYLRSWYIGLSGIDLLNENNHGNRKTKYRKFIELLGLDKTKNDKIVPKEIMSGTKEMRHMFLAGLFDSDGYGGEDVTHICSNNIYMLHQIRKLLSLDDISCYLTPDEKHLHITNSCKFRKIIEKHLVIKSIKNNNTGYKCGSYPRALLKEHIDNIVKSKKISYRKYFGGGEAGHSKSQIINPRNMKQRQFVSWGIAKNHGMDLGDITPMQIKSITPVDNARFYSISISETHNLIANGFVVSNCYQEQSMLISRDIAGFSEQEADNLRKAIGKKLADLMAKVKVMFLEGAEKTNVVDKTISEKIFEWIEASNRYSFNKSITKDSIVQTPNGKCFIEDLKVGDLVNSPNGYLEVKGVYDHGELDVYEIELECGKKIKCTMEHKFLCKDGEIRPLSDILLGFHEIVVQDYV